MATAGRPVRAQGGRLCGRWCPAGRWGCLSTTQPELGGTASAAPMSCSIPAAMTALIVPSSARSTTTQPARQASTQYPSASHRSTISRAGERGTRRVRTPDTPRSTTLIRRRSDASRWCCSSGGWARSLAGEVMWTGRAGLPAGRRAAAGGAWLAQLVSRLARCRDGCGRAGRGAVVRRRDGCRARVGSRRVVSAGRHVRPDLRGR